MVPAGRTKCLSMTGLTTLCERMLSANSLRRSCNDTHHVRNSNNCRGGKWPLYHILRRRRVEALCARTTAPCSWSFPLPRWTLHGVSTPHLGSGSTPRNTRRSPFGSDESERKGIIYYTKYFRRYSPHVSTNQAKVINYLYFLEVLFSHLGGSLWVSMFWPDGQSQPVYNCNWYWYWYCWYWYCWYYYCFCCCCCCCC